MDSGKATRAIPGDGLGRFTEPILRRVKAAGR